MADAIFLPGESRLDISSIDMPDTKAIYPGISGTTQGDRNDRSPAANTMSNDNLVPYLIICNYFRFDSFL